MGQSLRLRLCRLLLQHTEQVVVERPRMLWLRWGDEAAGGAEQLERFDGSDAARGFSGCGCAGFCSSTPSKGWSNDPECCGCSGKQGFLAKQTPSGSESKVFP